MRCAGLVGPRCRYGERAVLEPDEEASVLIPREESLDVWHDYARHFFIMKW